MTTLCPEDLRVHYHEGRLIPFVGAGVSMSVTWQQGTEVKRGPSWEELVQEATKLLEFDSTDLARVRGTDLQLLEYFKLKNQGQTAKLTKWIAREMNPPNEALLKAPIHAELAQMAQCRLFYTTNFDDFIERTFRLRNRECSVVAVEAHMAGGDADCQIVKFHGDLDFPDQIVLTESEYEQRLKLSTALDFRLRSDLLGRVVLFIGYSFRDPNVSYLFRLFTDQFWEKPGTLPGQRAYIAVPDPSDFEMELFRARRMSVIPLDGSRVTQQVALLLREMRG